jgi:1-acyl-sn-glycerol-3-phosphate acyltransferase
MKLFLDYFLSTIYVFFFSLFLLIFHPLQLVGYHLFGSKVQQKIVQVLNFFLLYFVYFTGSTLKFTKKGEIPTGRPIIFVSNHQSMFDIIGIIWFLRNYFPIFVSKIELSKGIPSISLNLRLSGAALIDRKDSRQAVPEIARMAKVAIENNYSPVIFPEGTRSKIESLKPFAVGGISILLKKTPNAIIVPIAIKGNNKLNPKGFFPLVSFSKLSFTILPSIDPKQFSVEELTKILETQIGNEITNN